MKDPRPKKKSVQASRKTKRPNLSKLLYAAYVRYARDPLTRRAVRQCIG